MAGYKTAGHKTRYLLLGALLALGCHSTAPQPVARTDQPKEETKAPAAAPSPAKPPEPAPAAAPPREGDAAPVVVDAETDEGKPQTHFKLSPKGKGWQVAYRDENGWREVPISGSLERVVDALVSSNQNRTASSADLD